MKKPKSSTGSQRTSVRGCSWEHLKLPVRGPEHILNISSNSCEILASVSASKEARTAGKLQHVCAGGPLMPQRNSVIWKISEERRKRLCLLQALVASQASASGGTKGRAGKVQHYLSGSPMWKGAGSTWLLVAKWLERSSVEKDLLQVLLDTTLTMTKQCALTAKTVRSLLGADHSPPLSTDEPQLEPKAQCWAPSTRQSCCEFSFCFA